MLVPEVTICPCGSGLDYKDCCGRYLDGSEPPPTAEALMRSRYTAYSLCDVPYLLKTWHTSTRPGELDLESEPVKWIGLQVLTTRQGIQGDDYGTVEFVARYKINGKAHRLHETSRFVHSGGEWFYLDGRTDG